MTHRDRLIMLCIITIICGMFSTSVMASDERRTWATDATTPGSARFSAQPTTYDPAVPASQSYFILNNVQSGDVVSSSVHVTNVGDAAGPVRLFPVDATTAQTGGVVYLSEATAGTDVGSWIAISDTAITLNPNQSVDIPFTVTVPPSPRSGQHLGGLVVVGTPSSGGGQVTIVSRLVVPVLVNLPPPFTESFTIPALALGGTQSAPGLLVGLRNNGNVLQSPTVNIVVKDTVGHSALTVPTLNLNSFVPQTQINYPVAIAPGGLPAGDYLVTVTLTYGSGTPQTTAVATFPVAYYYVPTLTGDGPSSGISTGGTTVTLSGFGFGTTADTQVLMNDTPLPTANIQLIAPRTIRFTAPAHVPGTVTFTVRVGGTTANGSARYEYGETRVQPPAPHPTAPTAGLMHPVPVMPRPTVTLPGNNNPPPIAQPARH